MGFDEWLHYGSSKRFYHQHDFLGLDGGWRREAFLVYISSKRSAFVLFHTVRERNGKATGTRRILLSQLVEGRTLLNAWQGCSNKRTFFHKQCNASLLPIYLSPPPPPPPLSLSLSPPFSPLSFSLSLSLSSLSLSLYPSIYLSIYLSISLSLTHTHTHSSIFRLSLTRFVRLSGGPCRCLTSWPRR